MAYSYNEVLGTGAAQDIAVPPYIDQSHIKVSINGVDTTSFTYISTNVIRITAASGAKVRVRRSTSPNARVVDYVDGVSPTAEVLDNDSKQAFYLSQEQLDATADAVGVVGDLGAAVLAVTSGAAAASASAASASASASSASSSASTATSAAGAAIAQSGVAVTQAGIASAAATSATASASTATTQAANASASAAAAAASAASGGLPVGTIISFSGAAAPTGFLAMPVAQTNISRSTYAALFAAIGTLWGAGDGSTTFGMPWLPADYTLVQANGNVGTQTTGDVKSHLHTNGVTNVNYDRGSTANVAGSAVSNGGTGNNTGLTGGSANLAAGSRVLHCVKY